MKNKAQFSDLLDRVILGDCINEMKKIPDGSVDLVVADPPYWKVVNQSWDFQWRTEEDYIEWSKKWFEEAIKKLRLGGSFYLFGYFRLLSYLVPVLENMGMELRQQIVVNKGMRSVSGRATKNYKMFPNVTESIIFLTKNSKPFIKTLLKKQKEKTGYSSKEINQRLEAKENGGGVWSLYTGENILAQVPTKEMWDKLQKVLNFRYPYRKISITFNAQMGHTDVWSDIDFYREKRYHPTQKPIKLIDRLILASSNEGDLVLDPFLGAGSTAISAKQLKRHFIGIELDPKFHKISLERLKTKERQMSSIVALPFESMLS